MNFKSGRKNQTILSVENSRHVNNGSFCRKSFVLTESHLEKKAKLFLKKGLM